MAQRICVPPPVDLVAGDLDEGFGVARIGEDGRPKRSFGGNDVVARLRQRSKDEMRARGINVSFASDNTRDPFYAYGDMDMLEVLREAVRIGHLDHAGPGWVQAALANPARACGFAAPSLLPGNPADLVIFRARDWNELYARPQFDRIVLRGGVQIDRRLPDYAELDALMRTA